MYDMKKLAELLRELEEQLVTCMRCGLCQSVCPVFAETGREADVARGKLALLDGLSREMFKDPEGVNERLMRCLLCGSCAANCPSGVRVLEIFIKARAILAGYMGLSPAKKVIFRGLLSHPGFFDSLLELGAKMQGFFVKPVDDLLGTSCGRMFSPLAERHIKPLAPVPFHRMVGAVDTGPGASGLRVGIFTGCAIDKIFPRVGEAVLRAMRHHGIGIFLPENQGCCGIPAIASGDSETFNRLLRHNLKVFAANSFDYLVTACATCTATIKEIWPMMADGLTDGETAAMKAIAAKTMDVSQFLVDVAKAAPAPSSGTEGGAVLTYHDPCHLKKSLGVSAQPRTLLKANSGYRFTEMPEADRCCGCGGSFNLQHYDISASIGRRKRDNIKKSGCSVVATSCPACMLQITDLLSQGGDKVQVKHAIEVYADSLA